MATPIKSVEVSIRYDNARVVTWELEPGYNYSSNFILEIENSRTGGGWETLYKAGSDACLYVDTRRRNWNKNMNEYYRVKVSDGIECYVSDPVQAGRTKCYPFSSDANNAIYNIEKTIKLSGVTGVLMKRKTFGKHCPLCTDNAGMSGVNEHCPRCFGTGIDGGYFNGISLNIIKDKIQTTFSNTQLGAVQGEAVTARCIAYPWIHANDVWCEDGTNNRYVITACTPAASYKTVSLVYTLALSKVEYTDSLYSAGFDEKVVDKDRWMAPSGSATQETDDDSSKTWNEAFSSL